jgi:hypothetical protein
MRAPDRCAVVTHSATSILAIFIGLHLITCLSIWAVKMKCNLKVYTRQSWFQFITTALDQTIMSFTLFWTLFYGLVYLY